MTTIKVAADFSKALDALKKSSDGLGKSFAGMSLEGTGLNEKLLVTMLAESFNPDVLEEGFDNKGKKVASKKVKNPILYVGDANATTVQVTPLVLNDSSVSVSSEKGVVSMSSPKIEWWATKNIMKKKVEVAAFIPNGGVGGGHAGQPMVFKAVKEGDMTPAALELSLESAQALVDALWAAGITPSQYSNQSAELKAVREHLADIKQVAFSFLDLKK